MGPYHLSLGSLQPPPDFPSVFGLGAHWSIQTISSPPCLLRRIHCGDGWNSAFNKRLSVNCSRGELSRACRSCPPASETKPKPGRGPAPPTAPKIRPRPARRANGQAPPLGTRLRSGPAPRCPTARPRPRDVPTARPRPACVRGLAEACRRPRSRRLRWQRPCQHGAAADAGAGGPVAVARAAGPDGDGGGSAGVAARGGGDVQPVSRLVERERGGTGGDDLPVVRRAAWAGRGAADHRGLSFSFGEMSFASRDEVPARRGGRARSYRLGPALPLSRWPRPRSCPVQPPRLPGVAARALANSRAPYLLVILGKRGGVRGDGHAFGSAPTSSQ